jgi:hypothetical protein
MLNKADKKTLESKFWYWNVLRLHNLGTSVLSVLNSEKTLGLLSGW